MCRGLNLEWRWRVCRAGFEFGVALESVSGLEVGVASEIVSGLEFGMGVCRGFMCGMGALSRIPQYYHIFYY